MSPIKNTSFFVSKLPYKEIIRNDAEQLRKWDQNETTIGL